MSLCLVDFFFKCEERKKKSKVSLSCELDLEMPYLMGSTVFFKCWILLNAITGQKEDTNPPQKIKMEPNSQDSLKNGRNLPTFSITGRTAVSEDGAKRMMLQSKVPGPHPGLSRSHERLERRRGDKKRTVIPRPLSHHPAGRSHHQLMAIDLSTLPWSFPFSSGDHIYTP